MQCAAIFRCHGHACSTSRSGHMRSCVGRGSGARWRRVELQLRRAAWMSQPWWSAGMGGPPPPKPMAVAPVSATWQHRHRGVVAAAGQSSKDDVLLQGPMGCDEVCETPDENLLGLISEPVMTGLVGAAPLLGGVIEECWHLPHLLGVVSPGCKPRPGCPGGGGGVYDVVSFLKASLWETRTCGAHGFWRGVALVTPRWPLPQGWLSPAAHQPTLRRSRAAATLTRRVRRRSILRSCLALVVTRLVVQFGRGPCIVSQDIFSKTKTSSG
jgi:hypothetical protein